MAKQIDYTLKALKYWSRKIEVILPSFGLDHYPQEFELVDYKMMLALQTYLGMPSFHPYWAFGKEYELNSSLYQHGLTGLPYELVINSNPSRAYLMQGNDPALQILTMCHVYGHNNFFKNNTHFRRLTNADSVLRFFKESADRIRGYSDHPNIGSKKVQACLTAAHALRYQCRDSSPSGQPDSEEDILLFLIENSPRKIGDWEKNIVRIVVKTFDYFRPQIMTKIMNEGWASFWHYKLFEALNLPPHLRFAVGGHHAKVVHMPDDPSQINPYFIGFELWKDIEKKYPEKIFEIMRQYEDSDFVNKFMSQELMTKLGLFSYDFDGNSVFVKNTPQEKYVDALEMLVKNIGLRSNPVIQRVGIRYKDKDALYLRHAFEGRHLDVKSVQKTLEHYHYFWPQVIVLETKTYRRNLPYIYEYDGTRHTSRRDRGSSLGSA